MDNTFSAKLFVQGLAQDLIDSFAKAGRATTPVLVGSARETAVRSKFENIFPQSIGVSTGCVIDVENHRACTTPEGADSIYFVNKDGENFQRLLANINSIITRGRTADVLPFNKYIINNTNYPSNGIVYNL